MYAMTYIYIYQTTFPNSGRRNSKEYPRRNKRNKFSSIIGLVPPGVEQMAVVTLRNAFKLPTRVPCHLPFGVELFVAKSPGNILKININNVNERPETYH